MASREHSEKIRRQIVEATDELLYHKGYNQMSFSDIAEASGIPRGNLNYHFKTKDEVLAAVTDYRLGQMREMLADWDTALSTPLERLKRFAHIPLNEAKQVTRFGCPMGSLNTELGKTQQPLQSISRRQMDLFREWLGEQFSAYLPDENADQLALHLLVLTQGVAVVAHIYADVALLKREVAAIEAWLEGLA